MSQQKLIKRLTKSEQEVPCLPNINGDAQGNLKEFTVREKNKYKRV